MSGLFVIFWNCVQVYDTFHSVIFVLFVIVFSPGVRISLPLFSQPVFRYASVISIHGQ